MTGETLRLYPQIELQRDAPKRPPTARQLEVLEYIRRTLDAANRAPSIDEIRAFFGLRSKNGISKHLDALEDAGLIKRIKGFVIPFISISTRSGACQVVRMALGNTHFDYSLHLGDGDT